MGLYLCGLVVGVFIDLLKMILVPLVFTSIVVGVVNLRAHQQIHKGWMATICDVFTTMSIANFIGLMAAHIFQPGTELRIESFAAAMAGGNGLAIVVFALITGVALLTGGERYRNLINVMEEGFDLYMHVVQRIMVIAPIGIAALLANLVATESVELPGSLAKFFAVVIGTTLFHGLVILPLILYLIARVSPLRFFVPIGAQVNMDGTALYEAAAALFVANLVGMDLTVGQQLVICFTTMLVSIGAPGIPSAGMVTMIMVLQSVGLPAEAVAILRPIDRLLDTVRTMVNVGATWWAAW